jgi:hypothetical protein
MNYTKEQIENWSIDCGGVSNLNFGAVVHDCKELYSIIENKPKIDIYVATPYNDKSALVREWRFQEATAYAAALVEAGYTVYSPITHSHPMAQARPSLGLGWKQWEKHDAVFMSMCSSLHVLMLPGWESSGGVKAEIAEFEKQGKSVVYVPWNEGNYCISKKR